MFGFRPGHNYCWLSVVVGHSLFGGCYFCSRPGYSEIVQQHRDKHVSLVWGGDVVAVLGLWGPSIGSPTSDPPKLLSNLGAKGPDSDDVPHFSGAEFGLGTDSRGPGHIRRTSVLRRARKPPMSHRCWHLARSGRLRPIPGQLRPNLVEPGPEVAEVDQPWADTAELGQSFGAKLVVELGQGLADLGQI